MKLKHEIAAIHKMGDYDDIPGKQTVKSTPAMPKNKPIYILGKFGNIETVTSPILVTQIAELALAEHTGRLLTIDPADPNFGVVDHLGLLGDGSTAELRFLTNSSKCPELPVYSFLKEEEVKDFWEVRLWLLDDGSILNRSKLLTWTSLSL